MSSNRKYRDEEWLRKQYIEKHRGTIDISEECECHQQTIANWLEKHDIDIRSAHQIADKRLTDRKWLREQYVEQQQTLAEIADTLGCCDDTVSNWLDKHGIDTRPPHKAADERLTDPEWLSEQYVEMDKSMADIAEVCETNRSVVWKYIHRHNIEARIDSPPADKRLTDPAWLRGQYVENRQSASDIAKKCGCSHSVVLSWLGKHGIDTRKPAESIGTGEDNARWKGGEFPYGPGWGVKKKRAVRERDDHTCQDPRCSVTQAEHLDERGEKLHVHHLRKARDVDDPAERNAKENLITLCRDCHSRWEKVADAGLVPQVQFGHGD